MFTGIVQGLGRVVSIEKTRGISRIKIALPVDRSKLLEVGQSIAINGVCLTVVRFCDRGHVCFDAIDETLRLTNLDSLGIGDQVNVERAARFGDEIGGHVLSGHIHGLALVTDLVERDDNLAMYWKLPAALQKYVLPKGYVALNGCSLTVGERFDALTYSVYLIPETRRVTNFGSISKGDALNLEIDSQTQAIVDTVERVLEQRI